MAWQAVTHHATGLDPDECTETTAKAAFYPSSWVLGRSFRDSYRMPPHNIPTVSWTTTWASGITSPAVFLPAGLGGGTQLLGWDGQSDPNFAISPGV